MSARSPRSSFSGASSTEVAQDFTESLKDLQGNNRYEISNLTIIAKENTEHAQAISKALEEHIRTTSPIRKLPALYVLDSIIKNVGTPYTVYLGRNLYRTFMEAYTLVDATTRRNMDAMLKTWKEPIPGSMSTTPVFPLDVVRPIENALIKAKTAAIQNQRQVQPQAQYRSTPTPPQMNGQYAPPGQQHPQFQHPYNNQQPTPQPVFQQTPVQEQPYQFAPPVQQPNEVDVLKRDIASLIHHTQGDFARNPHDQSIRTKLGALLQLQTVLNSQQLPPEQLQGVRTTIRSLSGTQAQPQLPPQPPVSAPQWRPPMATSLPFQPAQPSAPFMQPPSVQPQQQPQPHFQPWSQSPPQHQNASSAPALAPSALNGLQAFLQQNQRPSTPQMRAAVPSLQSASHNQLSSIQSRAAALPAINGSDLMAALAKAGVVQPAPSTQPTQQATAPPPVSAPPPPQDLGAMLASLQGKFTPQVGTPTMQAAQLANSKARIPMTQASLKIERPELIRALYDDQPNQCNNCGRRFLATDEGRQKKARHLDWHFRTNNRIADPKNAVAAHHRELYPDEMEWVMQKEFDPSTTLANEDGTQDGAAATKKKGPEDQWVRAPPGVTATTCPICQEEMRSSHPEELQDWVFMNAVMNGGRITHATCLAEMQQGTQRSTGGGSLAAALAGVGQQRQRSATPDSSLGKRKADGGLVGGVKRQA